MSCVPKPRTSLTGSASRSPCCGGIFDWDHALDRLAELNAEAEDPDLWNDPERARKVMRERNRLASQIEATREMEDELASLVELVEMAEAEGDEDMVAECIGQLEALARRAKEKEIESLLSGEADANDCYLEIHAGAGGTESQDWAEMLLRMYLRWAERRGYKTEIVQLSPGEEAGIKSVTVLIKGENAYGWLKTESGVHRLVRISPFDASARRHTSFASVWVYPVIEDDIEIEIQDKDIRVDVYRASGAGGQHVNRTESAVRITHLPTGIVVACQNERSQHQNRAQAMKMLKARLYELELKKREEQAAAEHAAKGDIGWGHQIRSYVLQPYQLVKDLRTGVESTQPQDVLDGDIDPFLAAALAQRIQPGTRAQDAAASGEEA